MSTTRTTRLNAIVGLTLAHGQLRAFHLARTKSGIEIVKSAEATLALDALHPEAELVGREIKNHLDAAGIRERRCVVAIPGSWLMSQHLPLPELAPEDTESLLQLEAEKGFPCDPEQLQVARSIHSAGAQRYVTQLAARREQLDQLARALRSAGLRPLSFSPGLPALPGVIAAAGEPGRITLRLEPKGATLLISVGGGIAAYRSFDATIDSEAGEVLVNGRALAREVRITFEQMPPEIRAELRILRLTGAEAMTQAIGEVLRAWAADNGLALERDATSARPVADQIAEQLARHCLERGLPALEFLPPKPSRWAQLVARYHSRRLATVGLAAAALALIGALFFGWQEYQRMNLRAEWQGMRTQVTALEGVQNRIREFRPWYDTGYRNLTIMKKVTECFPDNGSVTAKSVEIHSPGAVSISGTARDNAALLRTLDELRKVREVQGLKIEQIRGKAPAQQFTFTFSWNPDATPRS
jgi:hypothetical protein